MSDKETILEENVNKKALAETKEIVTAALEKYEGKSSAKQFALIREKLKEVTVLQNFRVQRIKALREEQLKLTERVLHLENEAQENLCTVIQIERPKSYYTRQKSAEGLHDSFEVRNNAEAVLSRIVPLVDAEIGIVGYKILISDSISHVVLFDNFIAQCEITANKKLNIDENPKDALIVYQTAMRAVFGIADVYAGIFGKLDALPVTNRNEEHEAAKFKSESTLLQAMEDEDDDSEGVEDDEESSPEQAVGVDTDAEDAEDAEDEDED